MQSRNMSRYFDKGKRIQCSLEKYAPKIDVVHWLLLGPFEGCINTVFEPEDTLVFHKLFQSGNKTFGWNIPHVDVITDNPTNGRFYSWSYHVGCFVWGLQRLSKKTGNQKYAGYADRWCEYTLSTMPLTEYQTKELNAVRSMNWGTADRPMLDYTTAPSMPFIARLVDENDFSLREEYVKWTNKITHYITNQQFRLEDGVLARQYTVRPSVWVDDMFMGIPYMLYAAKHTQDKSQKNMLYEDAAGQIILFNKYLFDPEKHLYMQACYADFPQKIPFWSRGNGWAIWATTEVLLNLPKNHQDYKKIMNIYRQHIDGLVNMQDNNGFWHNILDMPHTVRESSGTAIFTMTIARGINNKWLPEKTYLPVLEKAWAALLTFIDTNGNMHGVKGGTNFSPDPEDYAKTPFVKSDTHGVLPFLFACMEMEDIMKIK
jgi:rhamnogalacturonyl hydrolase YesR